MCIIITAFMKLGNIIFTILQRMLSYFMEKNYCQVILWKTSI